ncbi:MAG: pentapeptide repeat-containing protein [Alphaproteobacteria bacterium]
MDPSRSLGGRGGGIDDPDGPERVAGPWMPWENAQPQVVTLDPLYGRVCEQCDLSARALTGARLADGKFGGSDFSRSTMLRANVSNSVFDEANFARADLSHAKLTNGKFVHVKFSGAVMTDAEANGAVLDRADFTNADLPLPPSRASFAQASLKDARFLAARAQGASFLRAELRRADFTLAVLQRADFSGADLEKVAFDRADISGANFIGARNLTQRQLHNACGDGETRLPPGLAVAPCH